MFDLQSIAVFVAVAEELHFGRAATRMNMTQPPLSRQIQVLERVIDAQLLTRTSRSVRLTPAGQGFLLEARRILKLVDSSTQAVRRIAQGKAGSVKIGFTAAAAYGFLPELIAACRRRLPEIDLSLKEMVTGDQLEAFTSGQIEVGLMRPPIARPELVARRVMTEPLLAAVPEQHALASEKAIALRAFDGKPFVMYAPHESRYFHDLLVTEFSRANILPRYVQHVGQIHTILAMVRAGLGLAIVPAAAASLKMDGVRLRPLTLRNQKIVELFVVWPKGLDNPLATQIVDVATSLSMKARARR